MNCDSCGEVLGPDDQFCEACGQPAVPALASSGPTDCAACGASAAYAGPTDICRRCGALRIADDLRREEENGVAATVSDRGRRRVRNEDAFALATSGDRCAVVVCDGVATTDRSALAAGAAAHAALDQLKRGLDSPDDWPTVMEAAVLAAQGTLSEVTAHGSPLFTGSTTIVAALGRPGQIVVGNVGDSRAYWIGSDGESVLLTSDDTWARLALAAGANEEAVRSSARAHEITGWLGADAADITPHISSYAPDHDGFLVVCSDGLTNYVGSPREMGYLVGSSPDRAPLGIARHLVDHALEAGGADNVTVAVGQVHAAHDTRSRFG